MRFSQMAPTLTAIWGTARVQGGERRACIEEGWPVNAAAGEGRQRSRNGPGNPGPCPRARREVWRGRFGQRRRQPTLRLMQSKQVGYAGGVGYARFSGLEQSSGSGSP